MGESACRKLHENKFDSLSCFICVIRKLMLEPGWHE